MEPPHGLDLGCPCEVVPCVRAHRKGAWDRQTDIQASPSQGWHGLIRDHFAAVTLIHMGTPREPSDAAFDARQLVVLNLVTLSHLPHHPAELVLLARQEVNQRGRLESQHRHRGVERDLPEPSDTVALHPPGLLQALEAALDALAQAVPALDTPARMCYSPHMPTTGSLCALRVLCR